MPRFVVIVLVAAAAFSAIVSARAQSFHQRIDQGYRQLDEGDIEGALATFHELETDQPENDTVHYSIAAARYKQGLRDLQGEAADAAVETIAQARAGFLELASSPDPFVRRNAAFNAANCTALMAKQAAAMGDQEKAVEAFEGSIRAYEQVLMDQPTHSGALRNLEHMRYLLKKMLQNPPPPQEQQQQQQEGEQEQEQESQRPQDQQDGDQEQQENQEDQPPQPNPADNTQSGETDQPQEPEDLNRENIEAILQSLEDQDREEQQRLRRSKIPPRIRGDKWW